MFEKGVSQYFTGPIALVNGAQQFRDEIKWYCTAIHGVVPCFTYLFQVSRGAVG